MRRCSPAAAPVVGVLNLAFSKVEKYCSHLSQVGHLSRSRSPSLSLVDCSLPTFHPARRHPPFRYLYHPPILIYSSSSFASTCRYLSTPVWVTSWSFLHAARNVRHADLSLGPVAPLTTLIPSHPRSIRTLFGWHHPRIPPVCASFGPGGVPPFQRNSGVRRQSSQPLH